MKQHNLDSPVDSSLIDRIVDGGLTPTELREAVLRLEHDPAGWKRCAVAFLEAQVLNESCRDLGHAKTREMTGQTLPLRAVAAEHSAHRWLRAVAAAVVLGASFTIGWIAHGTQMMVPHEHAVARDAGAVPIPQAGDPTDLESLSTSSDSLAQDRGGSAGEPSPMIRAVATIRFGPENSPAEVPVLAGPGITEEWLQQQPPPVSEHGQSVLASQGYQVEQQRRFLTTVLADGRRVAIPVDHVQIQYTGNEPL